MLAIMLGEEESKFVACQFSPVQQGNVVPIDIENKFYWNYSFSGPTGNYLHKVNNKNNRAKCKICSKLTVKTLEQRHWHCCGAFIGNF